MNKNFFAAALVSALAGLNVGFADSLTNGDGRYADPTLPVEEKKVNERAFADEVKLQEDKLAKENSGVKAEKKQAPPVNMKADHCEYDNYTGEFFAEGNVEIVQGAELIKTTRAHGNMKTGDVYLEEGGDLVEPGNRMNGEYIHYNFNNKTGEIKKVTGKNQGDSYKAPHVTIYPDRLVADQGGVSARCPAVKHTPCLSVTAKTFEIYPQEKMVAHDVKVYIKGKHVYSRDLWVNRFEKESNWIPKIGYDGKDNGFVLGMRHNVDFTEKDSYSADLFYYTKAGFRPQRQVIHDERNWKVRWKNGWEYSDDEWVFKQNDFRIDYKNHHIVDGLPLSYDAYASYGLWHSERLDADDKWTDKGAQPNTWHREYAVYLRHDPIHFFNTNKNSLQLSVGKRWTYERRTSEEDFRNKSVMEYNATFTQKWGKNVNTWFGYYRSDDSLSSFRSDRPDMSIELRQGISYSPDPNNTFSIINRYDLSKDTEYGVTYRWHHMFCCWALDISFDHYREHAHKDSKLQIMYYFYNL